MDAATTEIAARNGSIELPPGIDPHQLLCDLVSEFFREKPGEKVIPLIDFNGKWLGNLVSPEEPSAPADRAYAQLPPQERQAIMKPLLDFDFDDILSDEEVAFCGWISVEDGVNGLDELARSMEFLKRKRWEYY